MIIPHGSSAPCAEAASVAKDARCPECDTRGYLIWPGYGNCQVCLKLRMAQVETWDERLKASAPRSSLG